VFIFQPMPLSL